MFRFPYRNFIRFLLTQAHSPDEIQGIFENRAPFIAPTLSQIKEIFYELLEDIDDSTEHPIRVHNQEINNIEPKELPSTDAPLIVPATEKQRPVAKDLGIYELWSVVTGSTSISGSSQQEIDDFKQGYNIFEKMTQPKVDLCSFLLGGFGVEKSCELVNEKYQQNLTKRSVKTFQKFFWDIENLTWSDLDRYINALESRRNANHRVNRLLRWALNEEHEKMAFQMGYEISSIDAEAMLNRVAMGEYIELTDSYEGFKDLNPYERNKITATMRQMHLFAKGIEELGGGGKTEEIEKEDVRPDDVPMDGHRGAADFEDELLEEARSGEEDDDDDEDNDKKLPANGDE